MGINELKRRLVPQCTHRSHVSLWAGKRFGIDIFGWLNRITATTDATLLQTGWQNSSRILRYITQALQVMINAGVIPVVVFDGAKLPAKAMTATKRANARLSNIRSVIGRHIGRDVPVDRRLSYTDMLNDIAHNVAGVDFHVVSNLIRALTQMEVAYVVAPYEADAQLAHMSLTGEIDVVVTLDSDLVLHGCVRVAYDYNLVTGEFQLLECRDLRNLDAFLCLSRPDTNPWWDDDMMYVDILRFCSILAGCDYYAGLPKVGLITALKLVVSCVLEEVGRTHHGVKGAAQGERVDVTTRARNSVLTLAFLEALQKIFDRTQRLNEKKRQREDKLTKAESTPDVVKTVKVERKQNARHLPPPPEVVTSSSLVETQDSQQADETTGAAATTTAAPDDATASASSSAPLPTPPTLLKSGKDLSTTAHDALKQIRIAETVFRHQLVYDRVQGYIPKPYDGNPPPTFCSTPPVGVNDKDMKVAPWSSWNLDEPAWLYACDTRERRIMLLSCGIVTPAMRMSSELGASGIVCSRTGRVATRLDANHNQEHPQMSPYLAHLKQQHDGHSAHVFAAVQPTANDPISSSSSSVGTTSSADVRHQPFVNVETLCADATWTATMDADHLAHVIHKLGQLHRHDPIEIEWYLPYEEWYHMWYTENVRPMLNTSATTFLGPSPHPPQWDDEQWDAVFNLVDHVEASILADKSALRKGKRPHDEQAEVEDCVEDTDIGGEDEECSPPPIKKIKLEACETPVQACHHAPTHESVE